MWFGTFGGLSRWDGENFTTFRPRPGEPSLAASVVFALLDDGDSIWIGTDGGGLSRFDKATEAFTTWRAAPLEGEGLSSDRVLALGHDARGRIWIGTGDGILNVLDPRTGRIARHWPPDAGGGDRRKPAAIRCIAAGADGRVWAGTEGDGLLEIGPDGSMRALVHDPGRPGSIGDDTVRSLLLDSAGRLWLGLGNGGVDRLAGEGAFAHASAREGRAPRQAVRALAEDGSGGIWVGWAEAGIGTLDPGSGLLRPPRPGAEGYIRALYRDRSGLLWAGLKDGGLRAYNPRSSAFRVIDSLPDGRRLGGLRGLAEAADGRIYAGTDGLGLVSVDAATGRVRLESPRGTEGDALKVYSVIAARDGSIWYGTDGAGLFRIEPSGRSANFRHDEGRPGSLASNVVWALHEDGDGTIWIGTEGGGLDRLDPGAVDFVHHRPDPLKATALKGSSVRCIFRDSKGRLWVGTWDGGLSRLEPDGGGFTGFLPLPGRPDSLGDASVNAVFEDSRGRILVGTGGSGIELLDEAAGGFSRFGEAAGLAGETVNGMLEAGPGELWISTTTGLTRWNADTGTWLTYGAEDGLADSDLAQNSYLRTRDGRLWFGGRSGLSSFRPADIPRDIPPPPIAITSVRALGGERLRRAPNGDLLLDWTNSGIVFTIGVLDYVAPGRNRYAMRIEGGQSRWTPLGHVDAGYLAPLRPGTWTLAATGANGNGVWSETGASLRIRVSSPFWSTPWFTALAALSLGAGVVSVIFLRIRSLRERNALLLKFSRHVERAREEERTNAAREVHDGIGQHLVALNLQAWWLAGHPGADEEEVRPRLEEMRSSIADAMAAVKKVSTNLRPVALDALTFGETLRWYVRDFGRRTGIPASAETEGRLPPFGDEAATALFRVLQEALTNVARHAGPCSVRVVLRVEEGDLALEVADDGVGLPAGAAEAEDSFGLIGMRERCAALGGSIVLEGGPGRGTRLVARLPLTRLARQGRSKTGEEAKR